MDCVKDFQTLIAGILAVCAAVIAFLGVVYTQRRIDRRTQIEGWRLEHGGPTDEPRHPDIVSGPRTSSLSD